MLSLISISILFFFANTNSVYGVKCKPEWTLHQRKCYRYYPEYLNHTDAHNLCLSQGAVLMNIKKKADIKFAISLTLTNTDIWVFI